MSIKTVIRFFSDTGRYMGWEYLKKDKTEYYNWLWSDNYLMIGDKKITKNIKGKLV